MTGELVLERSIWQAMRRHVARCAPREACGLLAGKNNRVELRLGVPNTSRSPVRYSIAPRAQWRAFQRIEADGLELVGIYHSHPQGPDRPSPTDLAEAMYPVAYLVWYRAGGKWLARAFRIEGGTYTEIPLQVIQPQ